MSKYYEVVDISQKPDKEGRYIVFVGKHEIVDSVCFDDGRWQTVLANEITAWLKPLDHLPLSMEQADPSVLENTLQQMLDAPDPCNQREYNSWILTAREEASRALSIYRNSKSSPSITREQAEKVWIRVEDKLPEHAINVLGINKSGRCFCVWYDHSGSGWNDREGVFDDTHSYPITHWQPLPEPPTT